MNRIVSIFLESAELHIKLRKDLTMSFWKGNVDKLLSDHSLPLLGDKGNISRVQADKKIEEIYLEFDARRKSYDAKLADEQDDAELKMLEETEQKLKGRK